MRNLFRWLVGVALIAVGLSGVILPLIPGIPLVLAGLWLLFRARRS